MIFSRAHQCVVYRHANAQQIAATILGAKALSPAVVAIPATLEALQIARLYGLSIPSITEISGYDWPMKPGRKPYAHQKYMTDFAICHPRHLNLSEMGCGKTYSALAAADYLMRKGIVHKCLIISPLSTLQRVWSDEIFQNFLGRRTSVVLHGTREQRMERLEQDVDFFVLNHDGAAIGTRKQHRGLVLGPLAQRIKERTDIDLIIVDEASAYKDGATTRTRVLREMIREKPRIFLMSGTPTPNAPTDAWSLARLIGGLPSEPFRAFRDRTMVRMSAFKWIPRSNAAETVRRVLTPAVRFSRAECIDLPPCTVETRDVELSPTQEAAYKELKKSLQTTLANGQKITAMNEAVLRTKLMQIACGAVYGPNREISVTDAAPRIKVLKEVIDEAGAKILVFAPFTSIVDLLYADLRHSYGDKSVARVYGDTSQNARSEIFRAFEQEAEPRIIVADPGTMSHGLTLVAANTIVWFAPTDKSETYDQSNARINRPGQKRNMLIVQLASTPVERECYKRLYEKISLQGAILKLAEEDR